MIIHDLGAMDVETDDTGNRLAGNRLAMILAVLAIHANGGFRSRR